MVDYDRTSIPESYDRARDHGPEVLQLWMDAITERIGGRRPRVILDLGCGTGRFSQGLAGHFDANVIGVDPSKKMLARAIDKNRSSRVRHLEGAAEAIPLDAASVDMIFTSMTFHHFVDRARAARECRRGLRTDGVLVVRAATREQIDGYAYMEFIPRARALHDQILPRLGDIRAVFEAAGFRHRTSDIITQTIAPTWTAYAEKLAAGGDSVLARLNAAELDQGLARVRKHAEDAGDVPVTEPIDLLVFELGPP
jgi:ubiquinone/menaquinone biosynthesis C-methylase UbiE